jgi:hypothetical protein
MSRQELVSAFLDGQISRRTMIRRLIAGGVSAGAAISYAQLLAPERAAAATRGFLNDQYPLVDLAITSPSLAHVRNHGFIQLTVFCTEELMNASFNVFQKTGAGGVRIGSRHVNNVLTSGGSRPLVITIDTSQLTGKTQVRFYIQMVAQDNEGFGALASTGKTLS